MLASTRTGELRCLQEVHRSSNRLILTALFQASAARLAAILVIPPSFLFVMNSSILWYIGVARSDFDLMFFLYVTQRKLLLTDLLQTILQLSFNKLITFNLKYNQS